MWFFEKNNKVVVEQTSPISGKLNQLELDVPFDKFIYAYNEWRSGELIQDAFPDLSADEREFLLTGITATEFDYMFGEE